MSSVPSPKRWLVLSIVFFCLGTIGITTKALVNMGLFQQASAPKSQPAPVSPIQAYVPGMPLATPIHQAQAAPPSIQTQQPQQAPPPQVQDQLPRPPPEEPMPPASIKQIANNAWRVVLSYKDGWFDTRIPVIANCGGMIRCDTAGAKYLAKLHPPDKVFFLEGYQTIHTYETQDSFAPDYQGTIWFKVDTEGQAKAITLSVQLDVYDNQCPFPNDAFHQQIHQRAHTWLEAMRGRIARD